MNKLKNGLMILLLLIASTAMLSTGIAGAASNDEYIMNITIDDISLNFANHASEADGNWIQMHGGDDFKLPSPMSFTYNGINYSEFSIMGHPASVELNVDNYTDHTINYPYTTHPMYVNISGKNDVSFTFDGSSAFAGQNVNVSLIKADTSELYSALDSKDNLQNLINSTERKDPYTLDGSGDLSVDYGSLNAGEYFILIQSEQNYENIVLSTTAFSVMEYDSNVNIVENENSITTNISILNAPASDYTYDAMLIEESEYKAEMQMYFNDTEAGLNASMNGVSLLEGLSLTGLDLSNPTSADLKNKLNQSAGSNKIVLQEEYVSGDCATLNLPTTELAGGNYILLTTVRSGSDLLAFDQSEVNLTNYDFELTVNTTSQTVEQNENANYLLTLTNTGNIENTITASIPDYDGITYTLEPGESIEGVLHITQSETGEYSFVVEATGSESTQSLNIKTNVIDALDLSVDSTSKAVKTGQNASYAITVENTGNKEHTFDLAVEEGDGALNKQQITLDIGETTEVVCNVSNESTGTYATTVTATDTNNAAISQSVSFVTTVEEKDIFGVSVTSNTTEQLIEKNANATYAITISNNGNTDDTYYLSVVNTQADYASLNTSSVPIKSQEQKTVILDVSSADGGTYDVKVVAQSQKSAEYDSVTTTTKVKGYGLTLSADSYSATVKPNEMVNYTLTLKNTGNVAENFTLSNPTNDDNLIMPDAINNLAAGDTATFDVALSNLTNVTATIKASSEGNNNVNTSLELYLVVEEKDRYGAALSIDPVSNTMEIDGDKTYTLKIRNTGNVEDTFSLSTTSDYANLDSETITLDAGESGYTQMTVSGINDTGTYTIPVSVESESDENVDAQKTAFIEVVEAVSMKVTPATQTVTYGEPAEYVVKITNTGAQTHTYNLAVSDNSSNTTAVLNRATITDLKAGESEEIDFTFNNTGSSDRLIEATLLVSVDSAEDKNATAVASALYLEEDVYGVSIETDEDKQAIKSGKNATYFLTVTNLGNTNETFNLTSPGTNTSLEFESLELNASGTAGSTQIVTLDHWPTATGAHKIDVNVSFTNVTDTVKLITRVAKVEEDSLSNSEVDGKSTVTNSTVTNSEIKNSLIVDSEVTGSEIKESVVNNTIVIDSELKDLEIIGGYVSENLIYNGTVIVDETEYDVDESEGITFGELVEGTDDLDSSISGVKGNETSVEAKNTGVKLTIGNKKSLVGGSIQVHKTKTPSKGVGQPDFESSGSFLKFDESDNINDSMEYVFINISYEKEDLGDINEEDLQVYWYDDDNGKWVALEAGNPEFCKGTGVNIDEKYVWAQVEHFSTYSIGIPTDTSTKEDTSESSSSGGGCSAATSAEAYENIAVKESMSNYIYKDSEVEYNFDEGNSPVQNVSFTSAINAGCINVVVEVLKDTSTLVDSTPSEPVYKHVNIWTGSRIYEDVIEDATVSFNVDKTWLDENDVDDASIKLMRYTTEWTELPTTMTGEDGDKVCYTANTEGFSSFAIVADTDAEPVTEPADTEADFSATPLEGQSPLEVTFTAEADNADSWQWDFGDGSTSTDQNPTHTYEEPGNYTVVLTVEGEGGVDVVEKTDLITVAAQGEDKGTPGFEAIFAIAGLLAVAGLLRRRKQ